MSKILYQEDLDEEAICAQCGEHGPMELNCPQHGDIINVTYHPIKGYLNLICPECGRALAIVAVASRRKTGTC